MDGVESCDVDFDSKTATVKLGDPAPSPDSLVKAVEGVGFGAEVAGG